MHHHLTFPETFTAEDGSTLVVRPITVADCEAFCRFFEGLPARDRLFFQDDLSLPGTAERWIAGLETGRLLALLAFDGDRIVAETSIQRRLHGWTRHVGYTQVIVLPAWRGKGVASLLVRRAVEIAVQMGLDKVVGEVLASQRRERKLLEHLGFRKEAILHDHATDAHGNKHNVILLSNNVYDLWRKMEDLIIDKEFEVIP
jgi:ribosomal protein S18 acetylase RimI-like enzyme